jgi:hypothetical protein
MRKGTCDQRLVALRGRLQRERLGVSGT